MSWRRRRTTPRKRTATAEEEDRDDEKEKPGQEKKCHLQRFALRCGQFQVPSPHQFYFLLFVVDLKLAWPQGGTLSDNGMPGEGRGGRQRGGGCWGGGQCQRGGGRQQEGKSRAGERMSLSAKFRPAEGLDDGACHMPSCAVRSWEGWAQLDDLLSGIREVDLLPRRSGQIYSGSWPHQTWFSWSTCPWAASPVWPISGPQPQILLPLAFGSCYLGNIVSSPSLAPCPFRPCCLRSTGARELGGRRGVWRGWLSVRIEREERDRLPCRQANQRSVCVGSSDINNLIMHMP